MIVVYLIGGLGNQMFQYAAATTLSELRNKDEIVIATDNYRSAKDRRYELYKFNFSNIRRISEKEKCSFTYNIVKTILRWYERYYMKNRGFFYEKLYKCIKCFLNICGIYISGINDVEDVPVSKGMLKHRNIYLYGYFQHPQYAYNLNNISLKYVCKSYELWKKDNTGEGHICVHIRLGDYINDESFDVCTKSYYYRAFAYIAGKVENPVFHIFSDSMEIVKNEFKFTMPVIYEEEKCAAKCLMKMSSYKYFIISNSTYSWWAQHLSQHEGKIVAAPMIWFRNGNGVFPLYEKTWKLIEP